ncbi:MAG: FAD-dependent oxidoreductase [Bacillota bacterium]
MQANNASYWTTSSGPSPDFPPLQGDHRCEVAIVGGGLTGITLAMLLTQQGIDTAVLEADTIGSGTTGRTTAKVTVQHGLKYHKLIDSVGTENARLYAAANQMGFEQIAQFVGTLHIDCDFTRTMAHVYAEENEQVKEIEKEMRAMDMLNMEASFIDETSLPFPVEAAIAMDNQAYFHPLKYLYSLVKHLRDNTGCAIYEHSKVTLVERGNKVALHTGSGTMRADTVVLATNYPVMDMPGFYFTRLHQERSYILCADAPDLDIGGMYINAGKPVHSFRTHFDGNGNLLLVGGYGHKTGQQNGLNSYQKLSNFLKRKFDGKHSGLVTQWSAQDTMTLDDIPYTGTLSKETPNIYIATGYDKWGMTNSAASALMIANEITGNDHPIRNCARLFSPHRFTPGASAKSFLVQSLDIIKEFTIGNLSIPFGNLNDVPRGEGKIMGVDSSATAVYRNEKDEVFVYNAHCTHMKCPLTYNAQEKSFDCPCHGSRFGMDGEVLEGPASKPLETQHGEQA